MGEQLNDKGISPLVAAVLLIAVTMTIAGVLAYWASSFVKTSLPETNETQSECMYAEFSIYSCEHVNSTDTVNLILDNTGDVELRNLKAITILSNSSILGSHDLNGTLTGIESFSISNVNHTFSKILVKTHCPEISREKTCSRS